MRYKVFISMILTILLLAACQDSSAGTGGFLWEVEEGDTKVYLQGTIHLGEEDFFPLQTSTEEAYEEADVVMPEIYLNDIDTDEMQSLVMDFATYDGTMTLEDHLPTDLYAEVEEMLESIGLEAEMYENFQPWYIEMLIMQLAIEQSDYHPQYGVDQYFLDRAEADGKEIVELESYEEQMEMLAGFSDDTQMELLEASVSEWENMEAELDDIVRIWREGDIDAMTEPTEDYPDEYMKELNDVRNFDMAAQIEEILENDSGQTYFVFVGTMHMTEEPSIVSILEDEGFNVNYVE